MSPRDCIECGIPLTDDTRSIEDDEVCAYCAEDEQEFSDMDIFYGEDNKP